MATPAPAAAPSGEIAGLIATARDVASTVLTRFGPLSAAQLNWQPAPDRWSVGQCLDHLVRANATYFPTFDTVVAGRYTPTLWQRMPWLPGFFGAQIRKAVHPDSEKAYTAPTIFTPAASTVDADIVPRFVDQQARVIDYLTRGAGLDLDGIVIASPVASVIVYSLRDAFHVIVTHEQRHVRQAQRVADLPAFPR
jgi:hypothetical protein